MYQYFLLIWTSSHNANSHKFENNWLSFGGSHKPGIINFWEGLDLLPNFNLLLILTYYLGYTKLWKPDPSIKVFPHSSLNIIIIFLEPVLTQVRIDDPVISQGIIQSDTLQSLNKDS
jgi:hypothetical protein